MDQETVIKEAVVAAVSAAIDLVRALGFIPRATGDLTTNSRVGGQLFDEVRRLSQESVLENTDSGPDAEICRIYVYIFGCKGCARLGKRLKTKIYKIGSTTEHNLETRLEQIGKEQYGAWSSQGSELAIEEGFSDWVALPITTSRLPVNPVLTLLPRTIQIDLPQTITRRAFDARLQRALAHRALHLQKNATPKQHTQYGMGGASRISEAKELYEFAPGSKADGTMLLEVIEKILEESCRI